MARYDPTKLVSLGTRRAELRAALAEVNALLDAEVAKAATAGIIQAEIARLTGMTREAINQLCRPKDQRWRRGKPSPADER